MDRLFIKPLYGFGDHLYLRPLVLAAAETYEVYIETAYPQIYRGTDVRCVQVEEGQYSYADLRRKDPWQWWDAPSKPYKRINNVYTVTQMKMGQTISSIISEGFDRKVFDARLEVSLTQKNLGCGLLGDLRNGKTLLVKMPAYAPDWKPTSRSPKVEYLIRCIKLAKAAGYSIVSITGQGDVFEAPELMDEWVPLVDRFIVEDLTTDMMIGLFSVVTAVLSSPNFTIPLCMSLNKPLYTVFGGHVKPSILVDRRSRFTQWRYSAPNPPCNCVKNDHDCNKDIDTILLDSQFSAFLNSGFKVDDFQWINDYGYFPVNNKGVYNDAYFDKYVGYEHTPVGCELNYGRKVLAEKYRHNGGILDVGIGSGQFLKSVGGVGFDVCPKAIEYLKNNKKWVNPWKDDLWNIDVITFFDSFEHESDIDGLLRAVYGKTLIMSIPIFRDRQHARTSKHFRPDEHYHYFTRQGLLDWMEERGYKLVEESDLEVKCGREDIGTFVFQPIPMNENGDHELLTIESLLDV